MKKSELKEMIRPIVAECVRESVQSILLESGLLATVISEVVKGLDSKQVIVETKAPAFVIEDDEDEEMETLRRRSNMGLGRQPNLGRKAPHLEAPTKKKIEETKKKLVQEIAESGYAGLGEKFGGVNLFEGITGTIPDEIPTSASSQGDSLAGIAPDDPGINIDGLMEIAGGKWDAHMKGPKKKESGK